MMTRAHLFVCHIQYLKIDLHVHSRTVVLLYMHNCIKFVQINLHSLPQAEIAICCNLMYLETGGGGDALETLCYF